MTEIWQATTGVVDATHVVLVHGALDRSAGLLKLSRRLVGEFRVTRYDRRGYGRSAECHGPYDMERQVLDLLGVIERAEDAGDRCVIVGHSYGGNVALAAADRHPELVHGVVSYESPLSWEAWWPGGSAGGDALVWRHDPAEAAERFMRRLFGDDRWEHLPASVREARRAEGEAMVGELIDLREHVPWSAERIVAPVLALHGERGSEHHRKGMEAVGAVLREATVHAIPGARHFGPNTHPDEVAGMVRSFVNRVS